MSAFYKYEEVYKVNCASIWIEKWMYIMGRVYTSCTNCKLSLHKLVKNSWHQTKFSCPIVNVVHYKHVTILKGGKRNAVLWLHVHWIRPAESDHPWYQKVSLSLMISALSATNDNCYIHRKSHWPKSPLPPFSSSQECRVKFIWWQELQDGVNSHLPVINWTTSPLRIGVEGSPSHNIISLS